MKPGYHIVIPARMASQRLPGKPLLEIAGAPLLKHVFDCAARSGAESIVVATDDEAVFETARRFGAAVVMTSKDHKSGSDRIAECASLMGWKEDEVIVNLQGDEPLMPPACLDQVAELLISDTQADVASLYRSVRSAAEAKNPNAVKVVLNSAGRALYFSRSMIPFPRSADGSAIDDSSAVSWKRHIGLYSYRVSALKWFALMTPTPLESTEKLEQLRFLESGKRIRMAEACKPIPAGVDTPDDLERVRKYFLG